MHTLPMRNYGGEITFTVDGVDWPAMINNDKKENNDMRNKKYYDELSTMIEFRGGKPYWTEDRWKTRICAGDLAGCLDEKGIGR